MSSRRSPVSRHLLIDMLIDTFMCVREISVSLNMDFYLFPPHIFPHMVTPTMFPVDKKTRPDKKLEHTNVLIPWYPISYLTIASSGFFGGGAYGSLPDAAIWWCLRTGGGGVLTR